jgi:hypothetical protein
MMNAFVLLHHDEADRAMRLLNVGADHLADRLRRAAYLAQHNQLATGIIQRVAAIHSSDVHQLARLAVAVREGLAR